MKGFSPQNLKYMRRFAEDYVSEEIGQQSIDQLPWGHIITLIYDIHDKERRVFYIKNTLHYGWSRAVLIHQIELNLCERQGQAVTNFNENLPLPLSDLAHQTFKDPYIFDFLSIGKEAQERVGKNLNHTY